MTPPMPPAWAHHHHHDKFGSIAEVLFSDVRQRFRWAPPGRFLMGSPPDEIGHHGHEKQHEVELTHGFWMADTPVTQALWQSVMGTNPSMFVHPERPVEQVSWEEAQTFIARLNKQQLGFAVGLPTEAQWEYACRAGTTTATYAGELRAISDYNAPVLDAIAWYGGNSGVDFDLADGWDASDWAGKQYKFDRAGTRIVGRKRPNPWGLYDMLGNVWEWCSDWSGDYPSTRQIDPQGAKTGVGRVCRGGSWSAPQGGMRAAFSNAYRPDFRSDGLGFRLSVSSRGRTVGPVESAGRPSRPGGRQ